MLEQCDVKLDSTSATNTARDPELHADYSDIKRRQQQTWAAGDYARVGGAILMVSELLCEAVDLRAGQKVLDVATGSGNTALAAARRWCEVTGIDYVPALLERARLRAEVERYPITFCDGDAENLPFPDASFDVVLSTFGVMFAPDQEKAANEMLRVCRPGGKIGLASWTPDGFIGKWFRVTAQYNPPPPGLKPPVLWGSDERLRELFGDKIASLQTQLRSFILRYRSSQHWLDYFRTYFGPVIKTFEKLNSQEQEKLSRDLVDLVQQYNRSGDLTIVAPGDYLEVVAVKSC